MSTGYYNYNKKKKSPFRKIIISLILVFILIGAIGSYLAYKAMYKPNTWIKEKESVSIYIPSGSNFEDVKNIIYGKGLIIRRNDFEFVAKTKDYPNNIKPGHYLIKKNSCNNDLINLLQAGNQTPVKVIFNNIRNAQHLAGKVSKQIEVDSSELIRLLSDSTYLASIGYDVNTISGMFLPDTYEFYWTTDANDFIKRMKKESEIFWNKKRKKKLSEIKLNKNEVLVLASIIDKETDKNDEKKRIAGVYINRLKRNWHLQADPTLIFAHNDYGIKRVLNKHKKIDSPYNTYKYKGLPPGPICFPSKSSIDAVLNYEDHKYMYFCAKDDFSGYHVFAKTHLQHNINARKYRRALNKRKIFK